MLGADFVRRRPELFKVEPPDKDELLKPEDQTVEQPPESVKEEDVIKKGLRAIAEVLDNRGGPTGQDFRNS